MTYYRQGLYDDAEPLLVKALETSRRAVGHDSVENMRLITRLAGLRDKQGRFDEAAAYMAELVSILKRAAGRQDANANALNDFAWLLLTDETSDLRDPKAALLIALTANELTEHKDPMYLDTLALAYQLTGDTAKAIENQKKALALLPPGSGDRTELESRLATFEKALKDEPQELPPE